MPRGVLLLVALLLLGSASLASASTPATGFLETHASLHLPTRTELEFQPTAFYAEDTNRPFHLWAPHAMVHVYEGTFLEAHAGEMSVGKETQFHATSYPLTMLNLSVVEGELAGWFGFYPAPDAHLVVEAASEVEVRPAAPDEVLGNADFSDEERPDLYRYARPVAHHLLAQAQGQYRWEGGGALKFEGGRLRAHAQENTTFLQTGLRSRPVEPAGVFHERTERWVVLTFPYAVATFEARATAAFDHAHSTWDGTLRVQPQKGHLRVGADEYTVEGPVATVEGAFTSHVEPRQDQNATLATLTLEGHLRSTTFQRTPLQPTPGTTAVPTTFWMAVAALVVGGGSAGALLLRARQGAPSPGACLRLASKAEQEGRWRDAARHLHQARAQGAPAEGDLLLREARCLRNAGEVKAALAAYHLAAAAREDGEAELEAALLLRDQHASETAIGALYDAYLRKRHRPTRHREP